MELERDSMYNKNIVGRNMYIGFFKNPNFRHHFDNRLEEDTFYSALGSRVMPNKKMTREIKQMIK